jgi:hypothetical protein
MNKRSATSPELRYAFIRFSVAALKYTKFIPPEIPCHRVFFMSSCISRQVPVWKEHGRQEKRDILRVTWGLRAM